ncbi:MAG: cyclic pyranopterin monophosphate synthase MoaC [Gemmatimonadota bacterium]
MSSLPHLDEAGQARMVDVSGKEPTRRTARASGALRMTATALEAVLGGELPKGDALAVARVAGIMAAKRTAEIVPLCHPLPLDHVAVELTPDRELPGLRVQTEIVTVARTGAEMEALTAAAASLLALYDMAKSLDRGMVIESVRLESKAGGASGTFVRDEGA